MEVRRIVQFKGGTDAETPAPRGPGSTRPTAPEHRPKEALMPWFVVDDSAHTHPKIIKAGNAAMGLWMRCGSYAAQHLTDGVVPGAIASMYGTGPQTAKLVKLGLWHQAGHDCPRCPQPADSDFVMHDYHVYNPTRRQVQERRTKAAEKKRRQRGDSGPQHPNPGRNRGGIGDEPKRNRARNERESPPIHSAVLGESTGQDSASRGDSLGTRARAFPSPPLPSKEQVADVEGESAGSSGRAVTRPDGLHPLPDDFALTDAMRRWSRQTFGDGIDVDYETAQFVSHFRADGSRRRSWPDEWQKWMRRAAKWASERSQRPAPGSNVLPLTGRRSTTDDRVNAALALAAELRTLEEGTPQ